MRPDRGESSVMLLSSRLRVVRLLSAESAETSLSEQLFRVSEVSSVCSAMVCKSAELRDLPVTVRALETIVYSSPASVSLFSSSSLFPASLRYCSSSAPASEPLPLAPTHCSRVAMAFS